jgi:hypothetical protein
VTNRRQNLTEVTRSQKLILCGVVTVTFRLLSLNAVTKCYNYSKTVLQANLFPLGEYPINRSSQSGTHELLVALPGYATVFKREITFVPAACCSVISDVICINHKPKLSAEFSRVIILW